MTGLTHYSDSPITLDRCFGYDLEPLGDKPHGLWVSVDGPRDWLEWSRENEYAPHRLVYPHRVVLRDSANVLRISDIDQLSAFTDEFGLSSPWDYQSFTSRIDWQRLYRLFDGIIIAPYQRQARLSRHRWYYGWDAASGCMWNLDAIEQVSLK